METDLVPGKYQLTESDNFDNFMGALGVGYLVRSDAPARLKLFSYDWKYVLKKRSAWSHCRNVYVWGDDKEICDFGRFGRHESYWWVIYDLFFPID